MKRIIAAITAACIIGAAVPKMESWAPDAVITADAADTVASGTCGESVNWQLNSSGTLYVTGTGATENWVVRSASWTIGNMSNILVYFIDDIEPPWYEYRAEIKKIAVGSGVTYIGAGAFAGLVNVTSVSLPDGLETINGTVFEYCIGLTSIDIPDSVRFVGGYAFGDCHNLSTIDLGNGVSTIGNGAFYYCESLKSIDIPASVDSIYMAPFENCTSLETINVDSNNSYFKSISGVLVDKDVTEVIAYPAAKTAGSCTVPNTVEKICNSAFAGNPYLRTVKLSSSLKEIDSRAFMNCSGLTSITIPGSVESIGFYAFAYCDSLKEAVVPKSVSLLKGGAFAYCESLEMVMIMNDSCVMDGDEDMICNKSAVYTGSIVGYKGSTAQSYAEKYGYTFDPIRNRGDVNADSYTDSSDAALILRHYAAAQSDGKGTLTYYTRNYIADCNTDGAVDSSDAAMILKYYAENQAK